MENKKSESTILESDDKMKKNAGAGKFGKIGTSAAAGAVLGFAAPIVTSAIDAPEIIDGHVVADDAVNDSMSFAEAFAAARAEGGPGALFHWHGGTYLAVYENEVEAPATPAAEETAHVDPDPNKNDSGRISTAVDDPDGNDVIAQVDPDPNKNESGKISTAVDDPEVLVAEVEEPDVIFGDEPQSMEDPAALWIDPNEDVVFSDNGIDVACEDIDCGLPYEPEVDDMAELTDDLIS